MGIDMWTLGSNVTFAFNGGFTEADVVREAKQYLENNREEIRRMAYQADMDIVSTATTLEELFLAFRQTLIRDDDTNEPVAMIGYDDRWYDPLLLMQSLCSNLTDGAWIVARQDNATVGYVKENGEVISRFVTDWEDDPSELFEGTKLIEEFSVKQYNAMPDLTSDARMDLYNEVYDRYIP